MINYQKKKVVEAIHEGRIVKVYEDDAVREGLFILREVQVVPEVKQESKKEEKKLLFEDFRRPLKQKQNLTADLLDNFYWILGEKRRRRGLTRKQLAAAVETTENEIKMIENGMMENYILLNRLEKFFGVNLRKSGNYQEPARDLVSPYKNDEKPAKDFSKKVEENLDLFNDLDVVDK